MTKDLGVWKAADCALVLIDYQREMFEVIRSETSAELVRGGDQRPDRAGCHRPCSAERLAATATRAAWRSGWLYGGKASTACSRRGAIDLVAPRPR
jgi:hypothetical protein